MKIYWLKWVDPLAHLVYDQKSEEPLEYQEAQDSFLAPDASLFDNDSPKKGNIGPSILGPHGIIPLQESTLPSKLFNFWVGHTDFDITFDIAQKIAKVPGVESLDIFTRYRFRMAIGKAFDQNIVKNNVQEVVSGSGKLQVDMDNLQQMLQHKYNFWAIGWMPDGLVEIAGGESMDEVKNKLEKFKDRAEKVLVSW